MTRPWVAGLILLAWVPAYGQKDELAPGKFLIADRELGDPNFAETVILVVNYDHDDGALGLIINRRTEVSLARVLRDVKGAKGRTDPVYLGGPVESAGVLAMLRSPSKPEEAQHIFADVYLVSSKTLLEKSLAEEAEPSRFHVYLGYAGWGPGQLEREMEAGGWHVLPAEVKVVFDADPDSVWSRLIKRTEMRIARVFRHSEPRQLWSGF